MNPFLPNSITTFLWFLVKLGFVLAPPIFVLKNMLAHSVYLYGHRLSESEDAISYRFMLQNNEDVPLFGLPKLTLRIQILDADGKFLGPPGAYLGSDDLIPPQPSDARTWSMTFEKVPEYDTWAFDCRMNKFSRNIRMELLDCNTDVTQRTLLLSGNYKSRLAGRRKTPEWWWGAVTILFALAAYYTYVTYTQSAWEDLDNTFALSILAAGILFLIISPRSAPPIAQGYWKRITSPSTEDSKAARDV